MVLNITDSNIAYYIIVLVLSIFIIIGLYGKGITSLLFISSLVYMFWLYTSGSLSSAELLKYSFIPGGVAILPIVLLIIFVVIPALYTAWSIQRDLQKLAEEDIISQSTYQYQSGRLRQNPLSTAIELFRDIGETTE
jgi:hypothetical protein